MKVTNFSNVMGTMPNLIKQSKKVQQCTIARQELEKEDFCGSSSDGAVKITISSKQVVSDVFIREDALTDGILLQNLVAEACNKALQKIEDANQLFMNELIKDNESLEAVLDTISIDDKEETL